MLLRFYQQETIDAVVVAKKSGLRRVMAALPTGTGKTVIMSALPRFVLTSPTDVTVIVVNRDELVQQTVEKLARTDPNAKIGIEKAAKRATGSERYVVASVQTLRGARLDDFFFRFDQRIGLMQFDECHHAVSPSYREIANRLFIEREDALLFGVTATPQRADGLGLAAVFEKIVYSRDLRWAVEEGILVRPRCYRIESHVVLDKVATRMGDFAIDELSKAVDIADRNDLIVSAYKQHARDMRTLVFTTSVRHAKNLCKKFRVAGVNAEWASGKTAPNDRRDIVARFRSGKTNVLVNCSLYVEGFDVPEVRVLINARPTKSQALLIQMVGRALRPLDEIARELGNQETREGRSGLIAASRKPDAIILDIVDDMKNRGIATIPTLWGLPPNLDLDGEFLDEAEKLVKDVREKRPDVVDEQLATLIDCDVALAEFAVWTPPKQEEAIPMKSIFDWRYDSDNCWALELPVVYYANYPDGKPVPNFSRRYEKYRKAGGPTGGEEAALKAIGHDPESLTLRKETIYIRHEGHQFVVSLQRNDGTARVLGSDPEKNEAFYRSEQWIANNRRDVESAILARSDWKKAPPRSKAIKELVSLGVPLSAVPKNAGDALALAAKLGAERGVQIDVSAFKLEEAS